jgi:hypothetical protein
MTSLASHFGTSTISDVQMSNVSTFFILIIFNLLSVFFPNFSLPDALPLSCVARRQTSGLRFENNLSSRLQTLLCGGNERALGGGLFLDRQLHPPDRREKLEVRGVRQGHGKDQVGKCRHVRHAGSSDQRPGYLSACLLSSVPKRGRLQTGRVVVHDARLPSRASRNRRCWG